MKVSCPHCSQRIQLDSDALESLQGSSEFGCPACGARVPLIQASTAAPELPPENKVAAEIEEIARSFDSRYQIKRLIGRGGMGAVYEGFDSRLDRCVAIKILPPETGHHHDALARFEREAKAMAALDHPNIVHIHDYGQTPDGNPYFVMEFIDGMDVHKLRRSGQLDLPGALGLISQVCNALHYAHSRGIVHRDIKPGNILVTREGVAKVADFGLAKVLGTENHPKHDITLTLSGTALGTPEYMAPEQFEGGHVDHRADIYSLGVMLYDLLTGSPPRGAWPPPSQRVQIDVRLDEIVLRALQQNPSSRYQAASEVRADIDLVKSSSGGGPLPPGSHSAPLPSSRSIAPDPNSHLTPQEAPPHPSRTNPVLNTNGNNVPTPSLSPTLMILGFLALIISSVLALYMAYRKPSETHASLELVENTTIHRDIPPGMTAEDVDGVRDIFSHATGFIGISMEAVDWVQAEELVKRTGAKVLAVDPSDPAWPALHEWLRDRFAAPLAMQAWILIKGEPHLLDTDHTVSFESVNPPAVYPSHKALLYWSAGNAPLSAPQLESGSPDPVSKMVPPNGINATQTGVQKSIREDPAATTNPQTNWTFVSWGENAADQQSALAVTKDDVLMCFKESNAWYLMSSRIFPAMKFSIEFKHPKGASGGHGGQVVVGSPGPSDLTSSDWTKRIPLGFEFKLRPGVCGQLELPRADYSAELPFGQIRDGRRVSRSRQKDPVADEWNKLEIECTADKSVVARLNGEVVNAVAKVENVEGRIVLWPFDGVHFRNPIVTVNGKIEKLDFSLTQQPQIYRHKP